MLLHDVVATSEALAATRSRTAKTAMMAALLRAADDSEVPVVATFLSGVARQRRLGVGHRALTALPTAAGEPALEVLAVHTELEELSRLTADGGPGVQTRRSQAVITLFSAATVVEQVWLRALILENLRQGASDALLLDAIAVAAEVPHAAVRHAAMFTPDSGEIALAARQGEGYLLSYSLVPGRPMRPMLAGSSPSVTEALTGKEWLIDRKLDGIRLQAHRAAGEVSLFTRSLDDITERLPEVVSLIRGLPGGDVVLDGEALVLGVDGKPRPFQETGSRTSSKSSPDEDRRVSCFFFDALFAERPLIDEPLTARLEALDALVPAANRLERITTAEAGTGERFFSHTVDAGHEGVILKDPESTYTAGRRGSAWVKVKPRLTLDLVVLGVEWGSGRRKGWLSNLHLGARDGDGFVMLGKTFKGMTDEMLTWQTERFLALETARTKDTVTVRPEQVVEIALDGVQRSTRYPGGVALRFARVLRYRDDKDPSQADTLGTVQALLTR